MSGVLVERTTSTSRSATPRARSAWSGGARHEGDEDDPLQAHIDLLDRITDKQIHDLVAYLETMK